MTIKGVKKLLNQDNSELDEFNNKSINTNNIKLKLNTISKLIKNIKNNG